MITENQLSNESLEGHLFNMKTLGYNVIKNYYTLDFCNALKNALEKEVENYIPFDASERSLLDRYHMHDLLNKNIVFGKTLEDERLQKLIAPILGDWWIMYAHTSSSLPPKGNNYGSRIHVDCPRFIPNYVTNVGIIWALDDFTLENGATHVLPGSHNTEQIPTEEFFNENNVRLTCKAGDLIVFNARLWHAAGINSTDKYRHALTMNVCRPYMKQRMDWVRFIFSEISDQLNSQARRIIGFDTRLPSNLEEFFLPENNRLYKANQE
jgi:ectoine hydroxylase-related dioxygenase (phytanoyl-CoA dioxygenase family)